MFLQELIRSVTLAVSVGFFHVLLGPDHYLPFIALARAGKWSKRKTFLITFLGGLAHILSAVLLGVAGIYLGAEFSKIKAIESMRGDLAGWAFIAFGLVYFVWGMRKAFKNKIQKEATGNAILWIPIAIFVLGPCEPLIPVMMYAAVKGGMAAVVFVSFIFGIVTVTTMLGVVFAASFGFNLLPMKNMQRYTHSFAGLTICLCGLAIQFLGL